MLHAPRSGHVHYGWTGASFLISDCGRELRSVGVMGGAAALPLVRTRAGGVVAVPAAGAQGHVILVVR